VVGDKYNIRGEAEVDNLQLAQIIARTLGKELKFEMNDDVQTAQGTTYGTRSMEVKWKPWDGSYRSLSRSLSRSAFFGP